MNRRKTFAIAFAVLLLALLGSVAVAPSRLPRFLLGFAYSGPLVNVARWQSWVNASPNLFGPLGETARFSISESPDDSTALVFTRTRDGVRVTKTHFLRFRPAPLALVMDARTAEEMLLLDLKTGDRFWDGLKFLVQKKRIRAIARAPRKELDRVGLTGFLQVIDVIPPA